MDNKPTPYMLFHRPCELLSNMQAGSTGPAFRAIVNHYVESANTFNPKDLDTIPLDPLESVMYPGMVAMIRDATHFYPVAPISGDVLRITDFKNHNGLPCIAYITATTPDRSKLKFDDFQPNDLDVMLVITDTLHRGATCFQLTDFVFSESRHPGRLLEDSTCHGVIDGDRNEIFVHYQNIRAAAIHVIERLARRGLDTPDPTKSAAIWLLAGIRQGVMWNHRKHIDITAFINELQAH